jgi:hypothetical protein
MGISFHSGERLIDGRKTYGIAASLSGFKCRSRWPCGEAIVNRLYSHLFLKLQTTEFYTQESEYVGT